MSIDNLVITGQNEDRHFGIRTGWDAAFLLGDFTDSLQPTDLISPDQNTEPMLHESLVDRILPPDLNFTNIAGMKLNPHTGYLDMLFVYPEDHNRPRVWVAIGADEVIVRRLEGKGERTQIFPYAVQVRKDAISIIARNTESVPALISVPQTQRAGRLLGNCFEQALGYINRSSDSVLQGLQVDCLRRVRAAQVIAGIHAQSY